VKNYNFTIAVIGDSESAFSSALTLAQAEFEIFLIRPSGKPFSKKPDHVNIHTFEKSFVTGFSGTLGNFKIFLNTGASEQTICVGTLILDEKAKQNIPYMEQGKSDSLAVTSSSPFLYPGETSVSGLFLADPVDINISKKQKGAAAAVQAAAVITGEPFQTKGFNAVIDKTLCRGCGRCYDICPYHAVSMRRNEADGWYASVDEALCRGCGKCISSCPVNAADSTYRDNTCLEWTMKELLN
jgi:ferredoxin